MIQLINTSVVLTSPAIGVLNLFTLRITPGFKLFNSLKELRNEHCDINLIDQFHSDQILQDHGEYEIHKCMPETTM